MCFGDVEEISEEAEIFRFNRRLPIHGAYFVRSATMALPCETPANQSKLLSEGSAHFQIEDFTGAVAGQTLIPNSNQFLVISCYYWPLHHVKGLLLSQYESICVNLNSQSQLAAEVYATGYLINRKGRYLLSYSN
ncbi:hypothetical protein M433DRAFT_492403 [Acidomyces richmondensis BFW]|nr:MAG: hypothetical protein FE78DRAFT_292847 [Acidomyces sp. 'richmondensis']KYG47491.1 hypothetical protein M433DRAFT_492403 [Acidomyces richmondensis BFW]